MIPRASQTYWYESPTGNRPWTTLVADNVLCSCGGIRTIRASCPVCESGPYDLSPRTIEGAGGECLEVFPTFCGAEGRREDYQLLALMEREWGRPLNNSLDRTWLTSGMSDRAAVVILYWTYFESRMNRLVQIGLQTLPRNVQKDLSVRYDSVTSHMNQLYRILFDVRYFDDLASVGAESISGHLARIQDARNRFVHGDPEALSDAVVEAVVRRLKSEHDVWIEVYNRRMGVLRKAAPGKA